MKKNDIELEDILFENVEVPMGSFDMKNHNNSHYFLLPLFKIRSIISHEKNYINSYIGDADRTLQIKNPLHVLFRVEDFKSSLFEKININIVNTEGYKFSYYAGHNNGNLICYVFSRPEEETQCYEDIINGNYSKVPNWYIDRVTRFPFPIDVKRRIQGICRKEGWHKKEMETILDVKIGDVELWNKFEPHREIFRHVEKKKEGI